MHTYVDTTSAVVWVMDHGRSVDVFAFADFGGEAGAVKAANDFMANAGNNNARAEYKIVCGDGAQDCAQLVNMHMLEGWRPQGGLCYSGNAAFQAMTRGMGS